MEMFDMHQCKHEDQAVLCMRESPKCYTHPYSVGFRCVFGRLKYLRIPQSNFLAIAHVSVRLCRIAFVTAALTFCITNLLIFHVLVHVTVALCQTASSVLTLPFQQS